MARDNFVDMHMIGFNFSLLIFITSQYLDGFHEYEYEYVMTVCINFVFAGMPWAY